MVANRGLVWRAAWLVAVVLVLVLWRFGVGGRGTVIQFQFGIAPEELVGATVVIDGEERGTLERRGARTVNGFEVPEGDHVVTLKHAEFLSDTVRITTGFGAQVVQLFLDLDSRTKDGETRTIIRFQY